MSLGNISVLEIVWILYPDSSQDGRLCIKKEAEALP